MKTEKSRRRSHQVNEDHYLFTEFSFMEDKKIKVFVIADGMGGLSNGEKAARSAIIGFSKAFFGNLVHLYLDADDDRFSICYFADRMGNAVKEAIKSANAEVCKTTDSSVATGSTLSVVCVVDDYAVVANIGDSPVYLYREKAKEIMLVSKLQTKAELDVAAGKYEPYSQDYYKNEHYLSHSLGEYMDLADEDIYCRIIGKLENRDVFLAGSDGAFGRMQKEELFELIEGYTKEDEGFILTQLLDMAKIDKDDDQAAILYIMDKGE